ncbi:MAG: PTS fructose transporter subunit IIA [Porticoccus sp.]|jgi:PTS system nitrogen regulatory IIA component|nr:PTS fructose transporter subunit IIA [Porticoccus sp.]|tara:strand:- start:2018 stop:2503 length:486 start_codon:yes stop_codon:yes gene_type:complete
MKLSDLLPPENISMNIDGSSKKVVLENLSIYIASLTQGINSENIYQSLQNRERLGTTAIGGGIAIPHCRIPQCKKIIGAFFKLKNSIDFNSDDGTLVDLIFVLIVPDEHNESHLRALSVIAELLQNQKNCSALRKAKSENALHRIIVGGKYWSKKNEADNR